MSTYQKVTGPATVNLAAPSDDAITLGQVILSCNSTAGPITINLPSVASLGSAMNMVYVVKDAAGTAAANNITIVANPTPGDKINNAGTLVIAVAFEAAKIEVSDTNAWLGYKA
jgi:nicotinamide mononucleotide (NMN) deamidase PncC